MQPVVASVIFYAIVIGFCELCRRSLDMAYGRGSPRSPRSVKGFLIEALGTLQAIACVYENQLIVRYYGLLGFALVVFLLLNFHRLTNRGTVCSPPALLERVVTRHLGLVDAAALFTAELVGAAIAFRLAQLVWMLGISGDHEALGAGGFQCTVSHKVALIYVAAYEFIVVFAIRTSIAATARSKPSWTPYAAAGAVSIGLTTGFALVGPVALNPIIAFGRLGGCKGLALAQHLLTYWAAPTAGWITSVMVEKGIAMRSKKVR